MSRELALQVRDLNVWYRPGGVIRRSRLVPVLRVQLVLACSASVRVRPVWPGAAQSCSISVHSASVRSMFRGIRHPSCLRL